LLPNLGDGLAMPRQSVREAHLGFFLAPSQSTQKTRAGAADSFLRHSRDNDRDGFAPAFDNIVIAAQSNGVNDLAI